METDELTPEEDTMLKQAGDEVIELAKKLRSTERALDAYAARLATLEAAAKAVIAERECEDNWLDRGSIIMVYTEFIDRLATAIAALGTGDTDDDVLS